jgi:hypothetical protein
MCIDPADMVENTNKIYPAQGGDNDNGTARDDVHDSARDDDHGSARNQDSNCKLVPSIIAVRAAINPSMDEKEEGQGQEQQQNVIN